MNCKSGERCSPIGNFGLSCGKNLRVSRECGDENRLLNAVHTLADALHFTAYHIISQENFLPKANKPVCSLRRVLLSRAFSWKNLQGGWHGVERWTYVLFEMAHRVRLRGVRSCAVIFRFVVINAFAGRRVPVCAFERQARTDMELCSPLRR